MCSVGTRAGDQVRVACGLNGVVKSFDGLVEVIWSVSGKGLL